jgi:hypothetical protein
MSSVSDGRSQPFIHIPPGYALSAALSAPPTRVRGCNSDRAQYSNNFASPPHFSSTRTSTSTILICLVRADRVLGSDPGLKPRAESCHPFGIRPKRPFGTMPTDRRRPFADTPNAPLPPPFNQPTEFHLVYDPNAERARPVQLAAGLFACQQEISLAAHASGQPAAMAPDQVGKYFARLA